MAQRATFSRQKAATQYVGDEVCGRSAQLLGGSAFGCGLEARFLQGRHAVVSSKPLREPHVKRVSDSFFVASGRTLVFVNGEANFMPSEGKKWYPGRTNQHRRN